MICSAAAAASRRLCSTTGMATGMATGMRKAAAAMASSSHASLFGSLSAAAASAAAPAVRPSLQLQNQKRHFAASAAVAARGASAVSNKAAKTEAAKAPAVNGKQSIMSEQFGFTEKTEEADELPPPPAGVSLSFHLEHHRLAELMHVNKHLLAGISDLAVQIQTQNDADLFATMLRDWRLKGHAYTTADRIAIFDALRNAGADDTILRMLCDRPIYRLIPSAADVHALLDRLCTAALSPNTIASEALHIEALDKMYKCFAVVLYYDMLPTPAHYSSLIAAGAYGRTAEGLRRSLITANELASLGWKLDAASVYALVHAHIQQGDFKAAQTLLDSNSASTDAALAAVFRIRIALGLKDMNALATAFESLAKLPSTESIAVLGKPSATLGSEFWVPLDSLSADVASLIASVETETVDSQRLKAAMGLDQ
ncbi:hypothetical protein BC831DRAFT_473712 [Entophlyctis helioformis]|nr:hypothetical protein BC831DRAFT_473712 [Entophlyctis helioformis]